MGLDSLLEPGIEIGAVVLKAGVKLYKWLKDRVRTPPEPPSPARLATSRFANTEDDLATVIALRHNHFGKRVIVPDDTYTACWRRNQDSMKIVFGAGNEPIGYWSVIPVSRNSFEEFIAGKLTHAEMMSKRCLAWTSVDSSEAYLYVVGAVVPAPEGKDPHSMFHGMLKACVVADMFQFGLTLISRVTVAGVCGYPTRGEGLALFQRSGFVHKDVFVENDANQPVYSIGPDRIAAVKRELKARAAYVSTDWEAHDKKRFLRQIPARPKSAKRAT